MLGQVVLNQNMFNEEVVFEIPEIITSYSSSQPSVIVPKIKPGLKLIDNKPRAR